MENVGATQLASERQEQPLRCAQEPAVDVLENEHEILLLVDLPGVSKAQLTVELQQQTLHLLGERDAKPRAPFERSFRLPQHIDRERVQVSLQQGVARITLPKRIEAKPLRIAVH